ncbi:uncharacterized protein zgc:194930 isoform X1 [Phycodurus eques]|uniref:uncharacterized protein zgc:194930 isoform X1 n=3 Tax=Phycodurus eques TaxID=693459 RepID=UPI002ACE222C|nr:uncharacterized protein zgc:194930 isoform X1 [Phycodurus eques]
MPQLSAGQMGCQCCRMMKSYIADPSAAVDARMADSLYRTHDLAGGALGGRSLRAHRSQKEGFRNLAYSISSDSNLRLEVDNNHVNHRLHAVPPPSGQPHPRPGAPSAEGGLYIIQPDALGPQWVMQDKRHSQLPVYPAVQASDNQRVFGGPRPWHSPVARRVTADGSLSADEADEGVGGTPEYPCDTGDEESVLSADVQTSTASLWSADTRDERRTKAPDVSTVESGICVTKSEDEEEEPRERADEAGSVTDSMVAEALAALEAATAGEEED